MSNIQYVKFIKGTPNAWEQLSIKDSNTLYFISETNATNGKLYLGSKLIADGGVEENLTIDKITSILTSAGAINNSLLVYNSLEEKWELKPIETIIAETIQIMSGATLSSDGKGGLVPAPQSEEYHMFLRGDGTWANPDTSLSTDLSEIQIKLNTLIGENTDKSISQIINDSDIKMSWDNF